MKRLDGITRVNDDEWYTSKATADKLATWLGAHLALDTPILCPADVLPDGAESTIPKALRNHGFKRVRVTLDLPCDVLFANHVKREVIVTNPPFSLLVPFRKWAQEARVKFCVLSRPGAMRNCWSVPVLDNRFVDTQGRGVAAAWMQNIVDTSVEPPQGLELANCADCHRKGACPQNNMTGDWTPGTPRRLFGWDIAVKYGLTGWFCSSYVNAHGKRSFTRFFKGRKNKGVVS